MEWVTAEAPALAVLIALLALLATLSYRWLVGHRRDFQLLWERGEKETERRERDSQLLWERGEKETERREQDFQLLWEQGEKEAERRERAFKAALERSDKETERRERAIKAALERSDRAFETLTNRANELAKELADIAQRTARSEGTLEAMTAGGPRAGSKSTSAADEPRAVAAQQVPGEPPAE